MSEFAVIVHTGLREWYVAVAHPDGHYELIPHRFDNPHDAGEWVDRLDLLSVES